MKKTILFSLFLFIGLGTTLQTNAACEFRVAGQVFKCTRVWCPDTMGMTGCGLGDISSQSCDTFRMCAGSVQ